MAGSEATLVGYWVVEEMVGVVKELQPPPVRMPLATVKTVCPAQPTAYQAGPPARAAVSVSVLHSGRQS